MSFRDVAPVLPALRGARRSDEDLARWIEERYGVPVVDTLIENVHGNDRLTVWVRTREQEEPFRDATGNWDRTRNASIGERLERPGLFVIAQAVDPLLRERAMDAVHDGGLDTAGAALSDPSILERVFAAFGRTFVFLHTDAQAEALRGSEAHARLTDALWELVHARDEFGVVPHESFEPVIDSRQNLDENFEGSTYYYLL